MVSHRPAIIVAEAPIEHDGSPSTWTDPPYTVIAIWTHDDDGEPVTRVIVADGVRGNGVWQGTRTSHLPAGVAVSVARQHLPTPAPSWVGFGRREPNPLEGAVAGDTVVRTRQPMTGAEMDVQMRVLTGRVAPFGRGTLDLSALDACDAMRVEARRLVRKAFRDGGLPEVERLRDDVLHRAHLALDHLAGAVSEGPSAMGLASLTQHLHRAAEDLIADYHSH